MGNEATSARVAFVAVAEIPAVVGFCGYFLLPDLLEDVPCSVSAYLATPCTVLMGSDTSCVAPVGVGEGA